MLEQKNKLFQASSSVGVAGGCLEAVKGIRVSDDVGSLLNPGTILDLGQEDALPRGPVEESDGRRVSAEPASIRGQEIHHAVGVQVGTEAWAPSS